MTARRVTRAQRWTLQCLLTVPYCLNTAIRKRLLNRRLVQTIDKKCSEHGGLRFVAITDKGRRAIGIRNPR